MSARHVELVRPLLKLIPILKFNESYKKKPQIFYFKKLSKFISPLEELAAAE